MIWTISGAGRAVGKTTVAQAIADTFKSSIYCKCGHNPPKPKKPENFFLGIEALNDFIQNSQGLYEHIIVESNKFAYTGKPDINIYIDGVNGKTDFRDDADRLKAAADITVTSESNPQQWKEFVLTKISDDQAINSICDILSAQQQWLFPGVATNA